MNGTSTIEDTANALKTKGAKDILKSLNKLLTEKNTQALASNNTALNDLISSLTEATSALKDTYAPNIMRFMTKKDSYIKELVSSATHIIETVIPNATNAAGQLTLSDTQKDFATTLTTQLLAFKLSNIEKQEKITAGKGDMIENTTHDIMQKYMKKNFNDIAELLTPLIKILETKLG